MRGMKMAVPWSLALELKVCTSHSSMSSHRKAVSFLCFHSNCVHPACDGEFFLGHMILFWISKLYWLLLCKPRPLLPGKGGGRSLFAASFLGEQSPECAASRFTATPRRKRACCFQLASLHQCLGTLLHSGTLFFLLPQGSWDHAIPPAIPPSFTSGLLSGKPLRVLILCSAAYSTFQYWLSEAPYPCGLSSDTSLWIHISIPLTLQKGIANSIL